MNVLEDFLALSKEDRELFDFILEKLISLMKEKGVSKECISSLLVIRS